MNEVHAPPPIPDSSEPATASLETLCREWEERVEAYSSDKPFTAGPLRGSRLRLIPGENPALEIAFLNKTQSDLFLTDPKNKTSLRTFLISSLGPETSFVLEFTVSSGASDALVSGLNPATESLEDLCGREPIIKTLLDMFEGRVLDH